jgi:hypothetical protein
MSDIKEISEILAESKGVRSTISSHIKPLICLLQQNCDSSKTSEWYTVIDCICESYSSKTLSISKNASLYTEEGCRDADKSIRSADHFKHLVFLLFYMLCERKYMAKYILRMIFDCIKSPFESIEALELLYWLSVYSKSFGEAFREDNKIKILFELLQRCINEGLKYEQKKGISSQYEERLKSLQSVRINSNDNSKTKETKKVINYIGRQKA